MARLLDLVDQSDSVVLVGDPASPAGIAQGGVCTYFEDTRALTRDELRGRRKERPVEIARLSQRVEEIAPGARLGPVWFRYAARIDQLDTTAVVETARTANDDVARHTRAAYRVDQLVGLAVQEMEAADDDVVVCEQRCEIIGAIGIAPPRDDAGELRHPLRVPHEGGDLVTALSKLGKE
jgi:hypothetical protein